MQAPKKKFCFLFHKATQSNQMFKHFVETSSHDVLNKYLTKSTGLNEKFQKELSNNERSLFPQHL